MSVPPDDTPDDAWGSELGALGTRPPTDRNVTSLLRLSARVVLDQGTAGRAGCSRKNRSISVEASGPAGSV